MPASATGLGHYKARQVRHGLAVVKVRCCQGQLGRKGPPHPLQFPGMPASLAAPWRGLLHISTSLTRANRLPSPPGCLRGN